MPSGLFHNCPNIQDIKLEKSACHLPSNFFTENNGQLRTFYFDGNQDEKCNNGISIDKGVFSNSITKSLESLTLKTNQTYSEVITDLELVKFKKLKMLHLEDGNITFVLNWTNIAEILIDIGLDKGPLQYNCDTLEKIDSLDVKVSIYYDSEPWNKDVFYNKTVLKNKLRHILGNSAEIEKCSTSSTILINITFSVILLSFLLAITMIYYNRYYFYANPFWYKICCIFLPEEITDESEYDAFILSHDTNDCECNEQDNAGNPKDKCDNNILKELYHKLTSGFESGRQFNVSYRIRDYELGRSETENLEIFLKKSKRIIVLLTRNYVMSDYHYKEFKHLTYILNSEGYQNRLETTKIFQLHSIFF